MTVWQDVLQLCILKDRKHPALHFPTHFLNWPKIQMFKNVCMPIYAKLLRKIMTSSRLMRWAEWNIWKMFFWKHFVCIHQYCIWPSSAPVITHYRRSEIIHQLPLSRERQFLSPFEHYICEYYGWSASNILFFDRTYYFFSHLTATHSIFLNQKHSLRTDSTASMYATVPSICHSAAGPVYALACASLPFKCVSPCFA